MGCGSLVKFITKFILFLFNLIFTILGLVLTIAAIVLYIKFKDLVVSAEDKGDIMESTFQWVAIVIVSLGFVMFIIAFCGCVGSITENKCLLLTYAVFMMGIIGGKTYIAIKYNDINVIQRPVEKFMTDAFNNTDDLVTFRLFEVTLHCCGTDGPTSYKSLLRKQLISPEQLEMMQKLDMSQKMEMMQKIEKILEKVPATCCAKKITGLSSLIKSFHKFTDLFKSTDIEKKFCSKIDAVQDGCLTEVHDIIDKYGGMILKYMIIIIGVEVLELFASILLCVVKSQKKKNKRSDY